ncbi:BhlA/UviB family holin-like peptide [Bacillus cereus]|uniref:BhlA/UviB family holin-like peptide n=1 Tax=Bacillus cereus TaxID=1396 RepID=UPI000BEC2F84|nr:BhlA/UviB family holin-like peptide [Bacillus cereus]PEE32206.1 bacteriocin biosynthesis protein [Bacillus cereus]PET36214.1 bacteriocin biosynthesis protein [Bacillus cereus]PEV74749.1 bacteriocin biosynthesis protein [Bacillus cereus]PFA37137.1 bacteriocin biosynthesis protein [Bacillus cereus]PFD55870.1 bacteriocin biosynthesis protein [Bacillus cereus]
MEEQVFNVMLSQGAFGALFVWLLFSTRKESKELLESTRQENKEREDKYQQVIEKNQAVIEEQAKAFGSLSKEVSEIKQILGTKGAN